MIGESHPTGKTALDQLKWQPLLRATLHAIGPGVERFTRRRLDRGSFSRRPKVGRKMTIAKARESTQWKGELAALSGFAPFPSASMLRYHVFDHGRALKSLQMPTNNAWTRNDMLWVCLQGYLRAGCVFACIAPRVPGDSRTSNPTAAARLLMSHRRQPLLEASP